MQSGEFRTPITIKNYSATRNSLGELVKTFDSSVDVWAKVMEAAMPTSYLVMDTIENSMAYTTFIVRNGCTLSEESLITYRGEDYRVISIKNVEHDSYIQILTRVNRSF